MKNDIAKFLGRKSREQDILDEFKRLSGKKSDKQYLRKLELRLLKPKPIPPYHGPKTGRTGFKQRSLLIVFKNKTFIERIGRFVKINRYSQNNTYHVDLFVELIRLLEDGRLEFSNEDNKFYVRSKRTKIRYKL